MDRYSSLFLLKERDYMRYRRYYGDKRLKHRVEYSKIDFCNCIYCGESADSREHVPSKIFINKPYPENLSIVPACEICNNSFSADELYTWLVLKFLEKQWHCNSLSDNEKLRYQKNKGILDTVITDINAYINSCNNQKSIFSFQSQRIKRIIEKLARGHMVFELSEGYNIGYDSEWILEKTEYAFRPVLPQELIDDYNSAVPVGDYLLPEIGSRIYEHMIITSGSLIACDNSRSKLFNTIFLDWIVVQDEKYRYITVYQSDRVIVSIVMDEFLFASVYFKRDK